MSNTININTFSIEQLKSLLYDLTKEHERLTHNIKIAEAVLESKVKAQSKSEQLEFPLEQKEETCSNGQCSETSVPS